MFSNLATGVKELGLRFTVSALLPFAVLAAFGFMVLSILTADPPTDPVNAVVAAGRAVGWSGLAVGLVGVFVLAVVMEPFQIPVVRLLEGYWGVGARSARAKSIGVELQRRRRHRLELALRRAEMTSGEDKDCISELRSRLARYPLSDQLLPTALGNALRAGERIAGERYSLDTVTAWSRLYYLLPEPFQREVAELHGQVDGSVRLTFALTTGGIVSAPVLINDGWWNLIWIGAIALAILAYRGGVTAAAGLRQILCAAFDLHRFELFRAMHLPLPRTCEEEARQAKVLQKLWDSQPNQISDLEYAHPSD